MFFSYISIIKYISFVDYIIDKYISLINYIICKDISFTDFTIYNSRTQVLGYKINVIYLYLNLKY